jgi:PPOX class probable F420-dependent enzyme
VIPDKVARAIARGPHAHLATVNADGSPHVTVAWIGIEDDEVVIATVPDQRKLANIRREPRVSLSFLTGETAPNGLAEYVVLEGTARITEGGAIAKLDELAKVYWGPDAEFPMKEGPPGYITRIAVERVRGNIA